MKIMVTGATGFVGSSVVVELLNHGYEVIAVSRDIKRAISMEWFNRVQYISCDLHDTFTFLFEGVSLPDVIIHLAWPGLPNYNSIFHITENLTADIAFLKAAIGYGIKRLIVSGTCLEYGMQCGELTEMHKTYPNTTYGVAKDSLRKALEMFQFEFSFTLQWMRLFYVYGKGQNKNSLLSQLDKAIKDNKSHFDISKGNQLRDFLPIEVVAKYFRYAVENPECNGIINCCSAKPVSVIELVNQYRLKKSSNIKINRGVYPYPEYEPIAFWGGESKIIKYID